MAMTRVYFVTDLHGSEVCWRKFLNACKIYKADVAIVGGDITGKMVVPLVEQPDGSYKAKYYGTEYSAKGDEELKSLIKHVRGAGFYPYTTTPEEVEKIHDKPKVLDKLYEDLALKVLRDWLVLAKERLKDSGIEVYVTGGNDDTMEVSKVLRSSDFVIDPEGEVVYVDDHHEMVSSGYANITPWHCPRDITEEEIEEILEPMIAKIKDMPNAIFNFHVPPYDVTPLDYAPLLDENFKPVMGSDGIKMIPVGSKAVRKAIDKHQPLLGLFGHIHEGKGAIKVGRTMCMNPGSEYGEGILRGLMVNLTENKIKNYMFTSG